MFAAIIPNMTRQGAYDVTKAVCAEMKQLGVDFAFDESCASAAKKFGSDTMPESVLLDEADFVVAVGGDGSIIRAAKNAAEKNVPVLGINAGNVAFMAGLEADELSLLRYMISGDYAVDNRMMLSVDTVIDGQTVRSVNCLNDAVFARGREIYLTEMFVECDGLPVKKYRSDGMVFATPTGSTAYSFAAGGPIAEPSLECIIMTPISPYSQSSRCIIFSSESEIKVRPANKDRPLFFSADGDSAIEIPDKAFAVIKKCDCYASFIRIKNDRFWHILDNKIEK